MNRLSEAYVCAAEVIVPCAELDQTLVFFTDRLGFRLEAIAPADDPRTALVSGFGLRLRLQRGAAGEPGTLRLVCRDPEAFAGGALELVAPNGTRIELVAADPPLVMPELAPSLVVSRLGEDSVWSDGRAGMRYRDLVPDRQGGRFIASHIHIAEGGPVPDYVHFHRVHLQLIYCYRGWVRVVYEDQGPAFVLRAGDCVLQPPQIRHRVLECSSGLEVIEISAPAEHETIADHELTLPNSELTGRSFAGQRFVRHRAESADWTPWNAAGFECREFGLAEATRGIARARVVRASAESGRVAPRTYRHDAEFRFLFVLVGQLELSVAGAEPWHLNPGDAFVVPAGLTHTIRVESAELELLEVSLPA